MANLFQRVTYALSTISPLLTITALLWYTEYGGVLASATLVGIVFIICLYEISVFKYAGKNASTMTMHATKVTCIDSRLIMYAMSWSVSFLGLSSIQFAILGMGLIAIVIVILLSNSSTTVPNPILFFSGYHFYELDIDDVSGYILLSKRKGIRDVGKIGRVKRVFEYLLLDVEE